MTDLRHAAQAVLDRWDSPAWEWVKQGPTAALMTDLRKALAEQEKALTQQEVEILRLRGTCNDFLDHITALQKAWADIPPEFNVWWDADKLTQTNPYREDSPVFWAWEGWQAHAALAQPVAQRQPLTDEEVKDLIVGWMNKGGTWFELARMIEDKLKEKA